MNEKRSKPRRLVVGVTGASGPQLSMRLMEVLQKQDDIETHLVISSSARRTLQLEMPDSKDRLEGLADIVHQPTDIAASIASGSFRTMGMVVVPCSMKSLAGIATGLTDGLLGRAADVTLKERRPLVLVTREMPLNLVHIRNMETATLAGATILPPVIGFYDNPKDVDGILDHIIGRILDQFDIDAGLFERWGE